MYTNNYFTQHDVFCGTGLIAYKRTGIDWSMPAQQDSDSRKHMKTRHRIALGPPNVRTGGAKYRPVKPEPYHVFTIVAVGWRIVLYTRQDGKAVPRDVDAWPDSVDALHASHRPHLTSNPDNGLARVRKVTNDETRW